MKRKRRTSEFQFDHRILRDLIHAKVQLAKEFPKSSEGIEEYVFALDCFCLICHGEGHLRFLTREEEKVITSQKIAKETNRPFLICKNCYEIALQHLVEVTKKADHFQRIKEQVTEIIISIQNLTMAKDEKLTNLEFVTLPRPIQMNQVVAKYEEVVPSNEYLGDCNQLEMSNDDFVFTDDENFEMEFDDGKTSQISVPCDTVIVLIDDDEKPCANRFFCENEAGTSDAMVERILDSSSADLIAESYKPLAEGTLEFSNTETREDNLQVIGDETPTSPSLLPETVVNMNNERLHTTMPHAIQTDSTTSNNEGNNETNETTVIDKLNNDGSKDSLTLHQSGIPTAIIACSVTGSNTSNKLVLTKRSSKIRAEKLIEKLVSSKNPGSSNGSEDNSSEDENYQDDSSNSEPFANQAMETYGDSDGDGENGGTPNKTDHICPECGKQFTRNEHLKRHYILAHEGRDDSKAIPGLYKCPKCEKSFNHKKTVELHTEVMHTGGETSTDHSCPNCTETFNDHSSLLIHRTRMSHRGLNCPECGQCQKTKTNLLRHFKENHAEKNGVFICDICQNAFQTKRGILIHYRVSHRKGKTFKPSKALLKQFREAATKSKEVKGPIFARKRNKNCEKEAPATCLECGNKYNHLWSLKRHHLNFHENFVGTFPEGHKCSQCESSFKHEGTIQIHISLMHSTPKEALELSCRKCSETFQDYRSSFAHKTSNCGRGANCPECKSNFKYTNDFVRHFRKKHEGNKEGAYKCDFCEKTFLTGKGKETHNSLSHDKCRAPNAIRLPHLGSSVEMRRKFTCEKCKEKFYSKDERDAHLKNCGKVLCDVCNTFVFLTRKKKEHVKTLSHRLAVHCQRIEENGNKVLTCPHCQDNFSSTKELISHMRKHTQKCEPCGLTIKTVREYIKHLQSVRHRHATLTKSGKELDESEFVPFECSECHKKFRTQNKLDGHIKRSHGTEVFICEICAKAFKSQTSLTMHLTWHRRVKHRESKIISVLGKFKCGQCSAAFSKQNFLTVHFRMVHCKRKGKTVVGAVKCSHCGIGFQTPRALLHHLTISHKTLKSVGRENTKIKVKCPCCDRKEWPVQLQFHMELCHIPKSFAETECPYQCGFTTISGKQEWVNHIKICEKRGNEVDCICRVCAESFPSELLRIIHQLDNHPQELFPCQFCDTKFALNGARLIHHKSHPEHLPFKCSKCGKTFRGKYGLDVHTRSVCNDDEEDRKAFVHMRKKRNIEFRKRADQHICPECGKGFIWEERLSAHIKNKHGEKE